MREYTGTSIYYKIGKEINDKKVVLKKEIYRYYDPEKLLNRAKNYIDNHEENLLKRLKNYE